MSFFDSTDSEKLPETGLEGTCFDENRSRSVEEITSELEKKVAALEQAMAERDRQQAEAEKQAQKSAKKYSAPAAVSPSLSYYDDEEDDLLLPNIDRIPDIDSMRVSSLRRYLVNMNEICEMLEDDEPDSDRVEAYELWEERRDDLRSILTEIMHTLEELSDIADQCDISLM